MSERTAVRIVAAALALAAVSIAAGIMLFFLNRSAGYVTGVFSFHDLALWLASLIAFVVIGALIVVRRPGNAIGWLCLGTGLYGCLGVPALHYAAYALVTHPGSLPGGVALAVPQNGGFAPPLVMLIFIGLVFPTGHLISRRWRPLAWLTVLSFAGLFAVAVTSALDSPFQGHDNPIHMTGAAHGLLLAVGIVGGLASAVAAFIAITVRFRRSRGDERAQLKWLAFAAGFLVAALAAHSLADALAPRAVNTIEAIFSVGIIGFPVAIGIAILKFRLYEIDRIISRTLVYGALTIVLGAAYAGLVLAGQAVFSAFAGGSHLAIAVSTLVVAALFLPVRSRVQRLVDRRFFRSRYDAQRTLETFGARLREQVDLETLTDELRGVVDETLRPAHVSLWLQPGSRR